MKKMENQNIISIKLDKIRSKANKKSELMLIRCARAYSSSCSQVILVYLHAFRRIHSFAA